MAANTVISFKVFLKGESSEARRFTVDASAVTSFLFMREKLLNVFPTLRNADFKVTWKDSDDDEITITSDEDLITAFTEMSGNVKVLYITPVQHDSDPVLVVDVDMPGSARSASIVCDVCDQLITGFRYKCMQCPDYDLCARCEHQGQHADHIMVRVPHTDISVPRCARKFVNHIARSLRKSAYATNRDARHSARETFYPPRSCTRNNPAGETSKKAAEHSNTEGNAESTLPPNLNSTPKGCPFSSGEDVNMNQFHALGSLFGQQLGTFLEVLTKRNQGSDYNIPNQETNTNNASSDGLIGDLINNVVNGFFGKVPEGSENNAQQHAPETNSNDNSEDNNETTAAPHPPPMDVEVNKVEPPQTTRTEPGWTFVANTHEQQNIPATETIDTSQASAPTLVYHENPRVADGLVKLYEMGFANDGGFLTRLLERYNGDVSQVVKALVDLKI